MNFEDLKQEVDKLKILLDDPQIGRLVWHDFLNERIGNINRIYYRENLLQRKAVV